MTRTTLRIDEHILEQLKRLALLERRSLASIVDELLREAVSRRGRRPSLPRVKLPSYGRGGSAPGVDLSSNRSMLEQAEEGMLLEKRG